jgi:hypothetical protein
LETLANEALAQPLRQFTFGFPEPRLDCSSYDTAAHLTNLLREIEDLESAESDVHVLKELYRIAARQFEWQRGFFNKTSLYRSGFLFDGPACRARLKEKTGFHFNDLSFTGFALFTIFNEYTQLDRTMPMSHVGISDLVRDATIDLISWPIDEARSAAREQRANWKWIAYRPSVLRQKPCIGLRYSGKIVIAPLPALIMERLSSGIFYDVVSDEGSVRNEIGARFEEYCAKLLRLTQPSIQHSREFPYRTKKGEVRSPDILLGNSTDRWAIVECKSARMSFPARYSDTFDRERGYSEIAKAVFQIWRYVAHCRLGICPDTLANDCTGVVLTLDSWMLMGSGGLYDTTFEHARAISASKDPRIAIQDQIPVIFCQIPEWEELVTSCTEAGIRRLLRANSADEFRGWLLSSIPRQPEEKKKYRFPFRDMKRVVPWWHQLGSKTIGQSVGTGKFAKP